MFGIALPRALPQDHEDPQCSDTAVFDGQVGRVHARGLLMAKGTRVPRTRSYLASCGLGAILTEGPPLMAGRNPVTGSAQSRLILLRLEVGD